MLVFLFTGGFVLIYLENIWQQYLQGIKVGWYFYVQVGLYLYLLYLQYLEGQDTHLIDNVEFSGAEKVENGVEGAGMSEKS